MAAWQATVLAVALLASGALAGVVALFVWFERPKVGATALSLAVTTIGLAIVSTIAEAHGWTVDVTESQDGGARFDVAVEDFPDRSPPAEPSSESIS